MLLMLSAIGVFLGIVGLALTTLFVGGAAGGEIIGAVCAVLVGLGLVALL